jgi:CheY-like chemotaxis protein
VSRPRILLVEDEGLVALMLEDMIIDLGFDVAYSAASVAQALSWIDAGGEVDAALLDVNLGGEAVFPVADALKARGVPFAFSTGYGEGHDPRFRESPLLGKPIQFELLGEVLRGLSGA